MDLGSLPCACGLAVRPRRPFGITKSTAEAPSSGTGLAAPGANGLSADTAPFMLRRRGPFLIQGAAQRAASRRVGNAKVGGPPFETHRGACAERSRGAMLLRVRWCYSAASTRWEIGATRAAQYLNSGILPNGS